MLVEVYDNKFGRTLEVYGYIGLGQLCVGDPGEGTGW